MNMMLHGPRSQRTGSTSWGSTFALDRASVRTIDHDGRLHVAISNVSMAAVNPYYGAEVPSADVLGLDPNKIYSVLRDPAELAKAVPTFNNLPILSSHVPVSVNDHRPDLVVGSTGSDAAFVTPFMRCSLVFWAASAVQDIQSGAKRELSAAYHYKPVLQPGTFQGVAYDLRMTQIEANHISIVDQGRAGPDVVVQDAALRKRKNTTMDDQTQGTVSLADGTEVDPESLSKLLAYLEDTLGGEQMENVKAILAGKEVAPGGGAVAAMDRRRRMMGAAAPAASRSVMFPNANRLGHGY